MNKVRLLLLDVIDGGGFKEVTCGDLDDYYKNLKCDCFDIATRRIGKDKVFDIFCDDCGLFAEHPIVSAIDSSMSPCLVGNLIFAKNDGYGETVGLSDEDIKYIEDFAITMIDYDADPMRVWTGIRCVDY